MKHKFIMAGLMFIFSLSLSAETYSGTCGENLTWTLDTETGVLTISGTGAMTNYTYIGEDKTNTPWYSYSSSIKTVVISDGVTSIGSYAFAYCNSLTSITIPNSVTSIGDWAFANCTSLTFVTIPNSVTSIGLGAFFGCESLIEVSIPETVTTIGAGGTFQKCMSLTTVHWNAKNCAIGSDNGYYPPFHNLQNISTFTFGEEVETIPASLCEDLSGLTSVAIPNNVTSIGEYAFFGCTGLTSVSISTGVTSIGDKAFCNCRLLTSVTIPQNISHIGTNVFSGCSSIIAIEWNAENFESDFWDGWYENHISPFSYISSQIESFTFGDGVKVVPDGLCEGMFKVASIVLPKSVTSIGESAFCQCRGLTSIEIPNSVTSIGDKAFYQCSNLTSIKIPNSVTNIGEYAFIGCSSLPVIDNIRYADSYLVEAVDKTLSSYTIREGTKWIGDEAFNGCKNLTSVTILSSITSIEYGAFYECNSLTSVHIPDLAAWCRIYFRSTTANPLYYAKHLFLDGNEITELVIPDGVTNINHSAFINGSSFTSVLIPRSVTTIGNYAFDGCSAIKRIYCHAVTPPDIESKTFANYNAYLYVPCENFDDYDLHNEWGNFKHIECVPSEETAINTISSDAQSGQTQKTIRNGILLIERNGKTYTAQGQRLD